MSVESALPKELLNMKKTKIKSYEEIADECMGIIAGETVVGSNFYKACLKVAAIISERASNRLAEEQMKMPASITNPITKEPISFDYSRVLEADNAPINYEAIEEFKRNTEQFYE